MIETLFVREIAIAKHKEAPLLNEREDYLQHLAEKRGAEHLYRAPQPS